MEEQKLVSIITVCFNSEKTIRRTIESVRNQSYQNIEYIIIDGNSTDNTLSIIKEYEPVFQERLTVISEPDSGIYDAMNKGITLAEGEMIGIINSDDFYEPDAVEQIMQHAKEKKYQICYGEVRILKNNIEDSVIIYSHHFLEDRMIGHPSCFVSKAVYEKYGLYNTCYKSAADYEFMLRVSARKEVTFTPVYFIIANFCLGGISGTTAGYLDKIRMLRDKGKMSNMHYIILVVVEKLKGLLWH